MSYHRTTTTRAIRNARQSWAEAAEARALAKGDKAEHRTQRREGAARRRLLEALRFADMAEA